MRCKQALGIVVFWILMNCSCSQSDVSKTLRVSQVERILAGESSKSWLRVSRVEDGSNVTLTECLDEDIIVFEQNTTGNLLYYIAETNDCGASLSVADTTINGTWEVVGNISDLLTDTLTFTDSNLNLNPRVIKAITSSILELQYIDENSGKVVLERFVF